MDISNHQLFLTVKDHSVSKETFKLYHDKEIDLVYTHPQPSEQNLPSYYESEDYISHTDGKRSLFEKVYHFIKSIALKNKLNLINSLQTSKGTLLDIGAGTGEFLSVAKKDSWQCVGVEPNKKAKGSLRRTPFRLSRSSTNMPSEVGVKRTWKRETRPPSSRSWHSLARPTMKS